MDEKEVKKIVADALRLSADHVRESAWVHAGLEAAAAILSPPEPPPWTPKFPPGAKVRFIKDRNTGGTVRGTCGDNQAGFLGRVAFRSNEESVWYANCPHEDELELGEPIPAEPPVPLGPGDRIAWRDRPDTPYIIAAIDNDYALLAGGGGSRVKGLRRVGLPVEIKPGRAVHVLGKDEKLKHEGFCFFVDKDDAKYHITTMRADCSDGGWYRRHQLRLAAYLPEED